MEKKLPGVFQNPIDHPVENNKEYFYLDRKETETKEEPEKQLTMEEKVKRDLFGSTVKQKINEIFSSLNYVYKANVEIKLKDKTIITKIVGKNGQSLITLENELISIDEIVDIKSLQ